MNPYVLNLAKRVIRSGTLLVTDSRGATHKLGDGSGKPVHIRFNSRKAERGVALDPALKFGESYMEGGIDFLQGDVYAFLDLVFTNAGAYATSSVAWARVLERLRNGLTRFTQMNSMPRARRNVQHHYDLSTRLYDLFLDRDRQYSCAYFRDETMDIEQAQLAKKEHIAAKLYLKRPDLSVLDIGSGWGGLGLHLAQNFGADVTGVTLSEEQYRYSNGRVPRQMEHKARFLLKDFRNIEDKFDRIVSVGMFEHVGRPNYDMFFRKAAKLLKRDGVMVLHSIGQADSPTPTNPFIARYIFPGGYIPSLSEVFPSIERSGLMVTDVEILRLHYAETLKAWRERFMARRDEAKALYDEVFCRMWEFYLAASESAFRFQKLMVFQIQLVHDQTVLPLTRDYITDDERACALADGKANRLTAC